MDLLSFVLKTEEIDTVMHFAAQVSGQDQVNSSLGFLYSNNSTNFSVAVELLFTPEFELFQSPTRCQNKKTIMSKKERQRRIRRLKH